MWRPSVEEILRLHQKLIERTGGATGVRSVPLIESALQRFSASFGECEAYQALEEKAAAVTCGLIQNHGFIDGNKRVGVEAMRLILAMNDVVICYAQKELVDLGLAVAQGSMDVMHVAEWIRQRKA